MSRYSIHLLFHLLLYLQAVRKDDPDQMLRHGDHARKGLADEIVIIGKRVVLQRVEGVIHFIEARPQSRLCLPRVGLLDLLRESCPVYFL